MNESDSRLLRTTMVQAFAQTVVDESRRPFATAVGGKGPALREGTPLPVSAVGLPEIGDVVGGHYRLIKLLGQGMFGKVYVAQRLDVPEHQVALKLLPRSLYAGRNVERELVMLATVGHPHVVQLKDHGTTPDYVWLTMPVYQGETLAERLETKRTLTLKQAYDIFLPVARGLEALHAAGLRHQDVKPENIYLAVFGGRVHPILLDLGVAAEVNADFVAGTALYAAPEQVVALHGLPPPSPLSEKMDTYGLAATLLMALVGPKHFPGENATDRAELAAAQKERTEEPIGPGALPEATGSPRDELQAAFRSWLAARPENRPTMKELCEQLEVLLEPDAEEVRQEERRRERQRATIQRLKVAFAAMLVIGTAGAAVAFSQRETLRIAADLDKAKSEGRKSFSELGTCNAAHERDQHDLGECTTLRTRAREEHERQLEEVMRSGSSSQAEHAREVQGFNKRLKTCEDNAAAQKRTCDDETAHILLDTARDRTALASERDAAKKLADDEKAQLASISAERDLCRADRNQCVEEREACKAAAATAVRPAPAPRPVSSGAPFAPPSADPLALPPPPPVTPASTLDPKAPPPPPLPPPPPPPQQPAQAPLPEPKAMPQPPEPKTI